MKDQNKATEVEDGTDPPMSALTRMLGSSSVEEQCAATLRFVDVSAPRLSSFLNEKQIPSTPFQIDHVY